MSWGKEEVQMTNEVVVNYKERYSIQSDFKDIRDGWQAVDKSGNKETCLTCIEEV